MTQTSIGFNGTVNDVGFARLAPFLGRGNCIGLPGELAVTQVSGQRQVTVAAGRASQDDVLTTLDAAETMPATPLTVTNGQWFLLVLNRVWASNGSTSLQIRNGATTGTTVPATPPTSYPASLMSNPGVNSDQPIAWLWTSSAATDVYVLPIARPTTALSPRAGSATQRDAYWGTPGNALAQVWLQAQGAEWYNTDTSRLERYYAPRGASNPNGAPGGGWFSANPFSNRGTAAMRDTNPAPVQGDEWFNTDTGRRERYWSAYDATSNPNGASAGGWYPNEAGAIIGHIRVQTTVASGAAVIPSAGILAAYGNPYLSSPTSYSWQVNKPGWYNIEANAAFDTTNTSGTRFIHVYVNGTLATNPQRAANTSSAGAVLSTKVYLKAGDTVALAVGQNSGVSLGYTLGWWIEFAGPALVAVPAN